MSKRRQPQHPSHESITHVAGHVRADGTIVRGHLRRTKFLPPPYVAPQSPDANGMGAGEFGPMYSPGNGGPEGW